MSRKNYFKSQRWHAGITNALDDAVSDNFPTPEALEEPGAGGLLASVLTPVADLALARYDRRIRAYFRRYGIDVGDGVLTVDSIRQKLQAFSGLQIEDLSPAGVMASVEKPIAAEISRALGFTVTAVFDRDEFKNQVTAHVLARLEDGEGGGVLTGDVLHDLRDAATWSKSGGGPAEKRRLMNRIYQRRYRRTHAQTWQ